MQTLLESEPDFLKTLAGLLEKVHSPHLVVKELGLADHPSMSRISNYRDPMHGKIVYHADPLTLYRAAPAWQDVPRPPRPPQEAMVLHRQAGARGAASGSNAGASGGSASASASSAGLPAQGPASGSDQPRPLADVGSKESDMLEMLEVVSPDVAVAAAPYHTTFSHAVDDIFRSLIIRGAASMLADDDSDMTFCVKLNPDSLHLLCNPGALQTEQVDCSSLICSGWLFAQLIRKGVGDIHIPQKQIFKRSDWAIAPLRVLECNKAEKTFTVESSPVQLPSVAEPGRQDCTNVVLCLDSLPLQALLKICTWTVRPDLVYGLRGFAADALPADDLACLPALLADLLASGGMELKGTDKDYSCKRSLLCELKKQGLVQSIDDGSWCLTDKGLSSVEIGRVLSDCKALVRPRDIPFQDMECVDLLLSLHSDGWQCESVVPKMLPCEAYVHGESQKVWYHQIGKQSLCDSYLLLLLTAHEHKQPVPHLQPQSVYDQMLGKPVKPQTRKRMASIVFLQDPEVWVDESALLPLPKKRAPREKRLRAGPSQDALLDDFPELDTVLEDTAIEDGHIEGEDEHLCADASFAASDPGDNEAQGSSSSSSGSDSSRSSSSGSNRSSSNTSSSSSSSRGAAVAKGKAKARARHTKNMSASHAWGSCRLTPTKTGWQITCNHPGHRPEQASAACTKTRSNAIAGEDACLRMLKTWALWGQTKPTKEAHQKVWAKVLKAAEQNRLPSTTELDANPA